MAINFTREPIENADVDVWAQYELAQNRRSDGANTAYLYNDSGVLKLSAGELGIFDGNNRGVIENDAAIIIDISGNSDYTWIQIEAQVISAINVSITAVDMAGIDPNELPAVFRNSYDGEKGGFYINSNKRCIGLVYKTSDATSGLLYVINTMSTTNGYIGGVDNETLGIKFLKQSGADGNYYRHLQMIRSILTDNWNTVTPASDIDWQDIAWSNSLELFCACADDGIANSIQTSPDGINWSIQASAIASQWTGIVWSDDLALFICCADGGVLASIQTSPDGINWTSRNSAVANNWQDIAYSPSLNLLCCISDSGVGNRVQTSPDGTNWSIQASAADIVWTSVVWGEEVGLFVAVAATGSPNQVMTSPDGINWTLRACVAGVWRDVTYSTMLKLYCAVGSAGGVMTSPDGTNWTARTPPASQDFRGITWSRDLEIFCVVAQDGTGNRVMVSPDGINWTSRNSAADISWSDLAWSPKLAMFAAVAESGANRSMTSLPIT